MNEKHEEATTEIKTPRPAPPFYGLGNDCD